MATPTIPDWPAYTDDDLVSDNGTDIDVAFLDALGNAVQDSITGADNPSVYASAVIDEVIAARGGYADLDERLDQPVVGTINTTVSASDVVDEVVAARDDNPDLNDRLDNFVDDEIPDAESAVRGLVANDAQSWDGAKTFTTQPLVRPGSAASGTARVGGILHSDPAEYANVDGTEFDTMTYTLPANALDANGKAIRFKIWGKTGAGADNKTIRIYFDGSSIFTLTTAVASGLWTAEAIIQRRTAAAETAMCQGTNVAAGLNTATQAGAAAVNSTVWDNLAVDLTAAIIIKASVQNTTDASAAVVVQVGGFVELLG